jgi:hypothetical protein
VEVGSSVKEGVEPGTPLHLGASAAFPEPMRPQRSLQSYHTPSGGACPVPGAPRGAAPALLRCTSAGAGTPHAGSLGANYFDERR